jgi:hypothetical protein
MDMKKFAALMASVCLVPSVSHGADTAFGTLEPYGEFSVYQLSGGGFSDTYWYGDFGVRFDVAADSLPVNLGFYVGYEGRDRLDNGEFSDYDGYLSAAMVLQRDTHEVSIGSPRSVISDVFSQRDRIKGVDQILYLKGYIDTVRYGRELLNQRFYGVRYDTEWGATSLSSGLFWDKQDNNVSRVLQVAVDHEVGDLRFRAGLERYENVISDLGYVYAVGVSATNSKVSYGFDASLTKDGDNETTIVDLFSTYRFNDKLKAGLGHVFEKNTDYELSFSSVGVEFSPETYSFVRATVEFPSDSRMSAVYEATVGLRF